MVDMYRTLDSIPVLAKAGGILVMTDEIRGTEAEKNPESLNIRVFPGADGSCRGGRRVGRRLRSCGFPPSSEGC